MGMRISTRIIVSLIAGGVLLLTGMLGGCAPKQAPPPPEPKTALVNIINGPNAIGKGDLYGGEFFPHDIGVSVGGTVTWNNTDSVHGTQDVISNDGLFNQKLEYGQSFSYTFTQNGTFNYHDDLHDNMDGTVVVR